MQVSRKRKSENVTEHGPEESAPMAPVTEDAAAQEGLKRPPKASKVIRDSFPVWYTAVQCNGVERVVQRLE